MREADDIYIACCTEDGGILHCTMDRNGLLQKKELFPLSKPMYLAWNHRTLLAVQRKPREDSSCSSVAEIEVSSDGTLGKCISNTSTHGIVSAHVSILNGRIYTANYISGSITRIPDMVIEHEGHGPNESRQASAHPHQIIPTPDNRFLAVPDLGTDTIYTYTPDLQLVSTTHLPAGSGPRHLAFAEDGYAYLACELSSETAALRYENGSFRLISLRRGIPDSYKGENLAAAIRVHGDMVLVSERGHDSIAHFKAGKGELQFICSTSCGGSWPRDFIIFNDYLIVTNEKSSNVAVFRKEKGIFSEKVSEIGCPAPIAVIA